MKCTYCRQLDHATKYCPQLIVKWQEKRNLNLQMTTAKERDELLNIETVMCGGERTRVDVTYQGKRTEQWVRKAKEPPPLFDPIKDKDTYQQARKELLETEWITSTLTVPPLYDRPLIYDMPLFYDHSKRKVEKVSTLRSFLKGCL